MSDPIRIKLDENLGRTHVEYLQSVGYSADRVPDEGLSGVDDDELWRRVCAEGLFLITLDLDFSDVRRYPTGSHPGVLLLRPRSRSRQAVLEVLRRVVQEHPLDGLRGCLTVADESHTRIRRPASQADSES